MICFLSSSMQSTEGGKKFNAAVHQTGKAVISTGRAVGKFGDTIIMLS